MSMRAIAPRPRRKWWRRPDKGSTGSGMRGELTDRTTGRRRPLGIPRSVPSPRLPARGGFSLGRTPGQDERGLRALRLFGAADDLLEGLKSRLRLVLCRSGASTAFPTGRDDEVPAPNDSGRHRSQPHERLSQPPRRVRTEGQRHANGMPAGYRPSVK